MKFISIVQRGFSMRFSAEVVNGCTLIKLLGCTRDADICKHLKRMYDSLPLGYSIVDAVVAESGLPFVNPHPDPLSLFLTRMKEAHRNKADNCGDWHAACAVLFYRLHSAEAVRAREARVSNTVARIRDLERFSAMKRARQASMQPYQRQKALEPRAGATKWAEDDDEDNSQLSE